MIEFGFALGVNLRQPIRVTGMWIREIEPCAGKTVIDDPDGQRLAGLVDTNTLGVLLRISGCLEQFRRLGRVVGVGARK